MTGVRVVDTETLGVFRSGEGFVRRRGESGYGPRVEGNRGRRSRWDTGSRVVGPTRLALVESGYRLLRRVWRPVESAWVRGRPEPESCRRGGVVTGPETGANGRRTTKRRQDRSDWSAPADGVFVPSGDSPPTGRGSCHLRRGEEWWTPSLRTSPRPVSGSGPQEDPCSLPLPATPRTRGLPGIWSSDSWSSSGTSGVSIPSRLSPLEPRTPKTRCPDRNAVRVSGPPCPLWVPEARATGLFLGFRLQGLR